MKRSELEKHPKSNLIDLIQQHNIKRYSHLNKSELIDLILKNKSKIDFSKLLPNKEEQKELKKYLREQDKKEKIEMKKQEKSKSKPKPKPTPTPKPTSKMTDTPSSPKPKKKTKLKMISKEEMAKKREKKQQQTIKSVEEMISKGKIIIDGRKMSYFSNIRPAYKVQMFEDYIRGQVGEVAYDDWKRGLSKREFLEKMYGFFDKHKSFMDKILINGNPNPQTGLFDLWRIATSSTYRKWRSEPPKDPIQLVVKKLLDTKGEQDANKLQRFFEYSKIWDEIND